MTISGPDDGACSKRPVRPLGVRRVGRRVFVRDNGRVNTEHPDPDPVDRASDTPRAEPVETGSDPDRAAAGDTVADPAADSVVVEQPAVPLPPKRVGLLVSAALAVLALDIVTKVVAVENLEHRPPVELFGGGLYLVLFRNPGAAFSMATGMTWLLSLISIAVVVGILWMAPRLRSIGWGIGLGLVLGGALGNLVDRLFRAPGPLEGHVVDFLSLLAPDGSVWPVFNIADSSLVSGGVLLVLLAFLGKDYDGTTIKNEKKSAKKAAREAPPGAATDAADRTESTGSGRTRQEGSA
ncbi:signal peptidase II [Actinoalloteichus hymeniacidonis]|uniref:Lipoprotein signal peptidase n=1 Tax=Actinoalloteichus hymeniacidonis TaxID=340345 RepID=A0AAC9MX01_9PSEU|nr:signal peptidase II [Actinoalloteichus hymeniacidonis]AOS62728.1 lipoprotein signal peptidase [Actinoalloteichus hymeniacidonis]MBB5909241.1 signal peptidase II [Actinoalloteichus hymeniacidonis]